MTNARDWGGWFDPLADLKMRLIIQYCVEKHGTDLDGLKIKFQDEAERKRINAEFREWLKSVELK